MAEEAELSEHSQLFLVVSKSLGLHVLESVLRDTSIRPVVVTCDDRGDGDRSVFEEFHSVCRREGLKLQVHTAASLNADLAHQGAGVCLLAGWYWMVSKEAIAACRGGVFCLHTSLLPAFRGSAPLIWAIATGSKEIGATLFKVDEGMDEGSVVCQWRFDLGDRDSVGDVLEKIEMGVDRDMGVVVSTLVAGTYESQPQATFGISYGGRRRPEDSLVEWHLSSQSLERWCRALQSPYPRLFFEYREDIWEIEDLVPAGVDCFGPPGQVVAYLREGMLVSCGGLGDGVLVTRVRRNGELIDPCEVRPAPVGVLLTRRSR